MTTSVTTILLAAFVLVGSFAANAQSPAVKSNGASEMQSISADFNNCRKKRLEIKKLYEDLRTKDYILTRKSINKTELETVLVMLKQCNALSDLLDSEKFAQVSVKGKIDKYMSSHDIMPQEMTIISHYLDDLRTYGVSQSKEENELKQVKSGISRLLNTVPPPNSFTLLDGAFVFEKITVKNRPPFYISTSPLSTSQWNLVAKRSGTLPMMLETPKNASASRVRLSREDAYAFIAALSRITGQRLYLPNAVQAAILNKHYGTRFGALTIAVWLDGVWLHDHRSGSVDLNERDALNRFGMSLAPVWDPAHRLYKGSVRPDNIVGELPYAAYPSLGIILTASAQTAWNCQLVEFQEKVR